jgi:DNA-binding Xre family transcriptional regulator
MLDRDININKLRELAKISQPTVSKLRKGELLQSDVIDRICKGMQLQPGDWMEYIPGDMPTKDKKGSEN